MHARAAASRWSTCRCPVLSSAVFLLSVEDLLIESAGVDMADLHGSKAGLSGSAWHEHS